ncbi:MAG: hypothetical protein RR640_04600, partial [Oscillospiraceae bacterium]
VWEQCGQENLNIAVLDDAATFGTGIIHYYYDFSLQMSTVKKSIGEIKGEILNLKNIVFENLNLNDLQKQRYIIICSEKEYSDVLALCLKRKTKKEQVLKIKSELTYFENDNQFKKSLVNIYTKYYKIGGEVFYDICTKNAVIAEKIPLSPAGKKPITLYPIAIMQWDLVKNSILGKGEALSIIPNQKAINFNYAMMLLSVQQTAWPKLITKPGALQQSVTNEPGEHIVDFSANGNGISYLSPPVFSSFAINLSDKILDVTRTVSGVPQALTGESIGSNMAASAIIALQAQAKTPIAETQKRYWNFIKQIGKIWEQMFKAYVTYETVYNTDNNEISVLKGDDYSSMDFNLKVDVGPSSEYGESLAQSTLEMLLAKGEISAKQYVMLAPDNIVPFRERLLKMWENN